MKRTGTILGLGLTLSLGFNHIGGYAAEPPKQAAPPKTSLVKFRPPPTAAVSKAPSVRVTGGSRGTGDKTVSLDVLAPDHVGETIEEQPSLFWFQSRPAAAKFELTVLEENKVEPLLRFALDRATMPGIQRLKLSDYGARLVPGVEYQWIAALITDPENRSTDLVASGAIKRVAPPSELMEKLAKAKPEERAAIYADAGLWYDALAVLSDQIEANPKDAAQRQARADLLRQVGLTSAAQFENADAK